MARNHRIFSFDVQRDQAGRIIQRIYQRTISILYIHESEISLKESLPSLPLIGILLPISNNRHITIEVSTFHAPPLTSRSNTQHLGYPVRVHPTAHYRPISTPLPIHSPIQQSLLFSFSLPVRLFLCTYP
ncbi:unnamed protein product [Somion occarium]|uniref:Uncharacterized protein n=1 Tax=Somion occarium TaxID=3059160 RepID=A0ABP1D2U9_9APHY